MDTQCDYSMVRSVGAVKAVKCGGPASSKNSLHVK